MIVDPVEEEASWRSAAADTQPRSARGTFAVIPTAPIVSRRRAEVEPGTIFMPTDEEWEDLASRTWMATSRGATISDLNRQWGIPKESLRRALAHGRQKTLNLTDREEIRQWLMTVLEEVVELARLEGDYDQVRKASADIARLTGMISTGGNVLNVQNNNVMSAPAVDSAILAYIQRRDQKAIEGEVVAEES